MATRRLINVDDVLNEILGADEDESALFNSEDEEI